MKDPGPNDLLWKGLRGELSDEEKQHFESLISSDARLKNDWEEELVLNELLAKVPDAPLSSNFTSLVMQAVAKEERQATHKSSTFRWLRFGFARVLAGLALFGVIGLGLHNRYQKSQR